MFSQEFCLRYFEMNKHGEASPTTILTLLEETASDHCLSINHGLFELFQQQIGWVLVSGVIEMYRYPKHKENIRIQTWLSTYTLVKGIRENLIFDENNQVIGRAKGLWVFFDIEKRRPLEIFDDIIQKWSFDKKESIIHNIIRKISPLQEAPIIKQFPIYRYDIDMNMHVNNIKYLQWLLETIPNEIMDNFYLHHIDGRFINEAHLGESIVSLTKLVNNNHEFHHTVLVKETGKICATANSVWKER
jgi:acyl-ACP thioesterase